MSILFVALRTKIIDRMTALLSTNDPGRFGTVHKQLFKASIGLSPIADLSKAQEKAFKAWDPLVFDLATLPIEQLVDLFELTVRRFAVQR